jgi:hypothetical protein
MRRRYDMIRQSMDYQMSEIVKELDYKKSGMQVQAMNSSGRPGSNLLLFDNSETRPKKSKKDTVIQMTKQILN